ncbi:T9SS type A sorting domain-containing protein [Bacteroidota bacterium]
MKKLIPFLLVILSMSLFSQEPTYWEKIDFEFDSGIKFISLRNHINYPFVVTTDSSSVYYFDNYDDEGIKLVNTPSSDIKESHLLLKNDTNIIFILTEDKRLFVTANYGNSWQQIDNEVNNSSINSIAIIVDMIVIGTGIRGAYACDSYPNSWKQIKNGLENRAITELFTDQSRFYCLSDDKKVLWCNPHSQDSIKWFIEQDLFNFKVIKNIKKRGFELVFFDENNSIIVLDDFGSKQEIQMSDSIIATCFAAHGLHCLVLSGTTDEIPYGANLLIGTKNHGIYSTFLSHPYNSSMNNLSSELMNEEISFLVFNEDIFSSFCMAGTAIGNLYYAFVNTASVNEYSTISKVNIFPQPSNGKSTLIFTLPKISNISIKLYNTLGIELKTIADGYFNEGENSISIDVSGLADGVYLVAINYNGKTVVEKMVVRK